MAFLNKFNWLGFSLSPDNQELQNHHPQDSVYNSDEISAAQISGDEESCFNLTAAAASHDHSANIPSLNLPPAPFALLEAFSRNTHSQDWNMKDLSMNSFSCTRQNMENNQEDRPKLENFLGHFFSHDHNNHHQEHNKICNPNISSSNNYSDNNNNYNNLCQESNEATSHANNTIGLSMIKNWLRNNPAAAPPPHAAENRVCDEVAQPQGAAGAAQSSTLSLSMSTGSHESSINPLPLLISGSSTHHAVESCTSEYNKLLQQCGVGVAAVDGGGQSVGAVVESMPRKSIDTFGQRTSIYRGVTRHRWTGRYEAHLWDNSCRREGQTRKGRQVYLGGYDKEEKAARAYDLAALKYWGTATTTNFPISNYEKEIDEMKHMTRQEHVASLRRKSSGFSRGASIYRGVTRHHQHGRWQARIGRVAGNKDLYLGTFSTQEEAAEAYDVAAIKFRGLNAVTNFEINRYDVKSILESTTLPIGGAAKRLKDAENAEIALEMHRANEANLNLHLLTDHHHGGHINNAGYGTGNNNIIYEQSQPLMSNMIYPFAHQKQLWCKQEQDYEINNHHHHQQLQLGNTQNFLQPASHHHVMTNITSSTTLGSSCMEHSYVMPMVGPTPVNIGHQNQNENGGFLGISNDHHHYHHHHVEKPAVGYDHEGMFGSTDDDDDARNLYYHQFNQQSKASVYHDQDQSSCNNDWNNIPTAVPTVAARNNSMGAAICHGASTFTVWNDT